MMRIFLDHGAAARRVHHDGLDLAVLNERPPRVDVGAHLRHGFVLRIQMETDRAAAAGARRNARADADGIQHADGGGVDGGHHGRLHAAGQHQHLPCVLPHLGQRPRVAAFRHLAPERLRQQPAQALAQPHGGREHRRQHRLAQQGAPGSIAP